MMHKESASSQDLTAYIHFAKKGGKGSLGSRLSRQSGSLHFSRPRQQNGFVAELPTQKESSG